jgi:hypothetical protein
MNLQCFEIVAAIMFRNQRIIFLGNLNFKRVAGGLGFAVLL